ncbi:radiation sensitive protein rad9 [Madurella fahalii]|uniref:Radiation sensitive protein rad9 n=1 Tax=Madurella fahalii TaxID=1157608 RepID=A0ABQ0G9L7_9PEZI
MASKSIRQAEKKALEGANESQDTLVVAHYLMLDYGVGLRSSSPAPGEVLSLPSPERSTPPSERGCGNSLARAGKSTGETRGTRAVNVARQNRRSRSAGSRRSENQEGEQPAVAPQDRDAADEDGVVGDPCLTDTLPQTHDPSVDINAAPPTRKMDSTQSTQLNTGRSYEQYICPPSPGHALPDLRDPSASKSVSGSSPRRGTLDHDDTGAVQFDFANAGDTETTIPPVQDGSGLVDFAGLAHLRRDYSQNAAHSTTQHPPETPAQSRNPFRHSRSQLLPTSQLFRGTQFSSPVKQASPTSSRPSPADFPNNSISPNPVISSPLKARGLRSSPIVDPTSSPEILPGTTSSRLHNGPSSPTSTQNPVVPESSHNQFSRKKSIPEPMSTYEPMRKSQERRATSEIRSDPIVSGEYDDDDDSIVKRRRVRAKKEAALKQLTAISLPRVVRPDDVEVPSTNQRRRASETEMCIAQCHERGAADTDSEGVDTVEESQKHPPEPVPRHVSEDHDSTQSGAYEEPEPMPEPMPSVVPELPRSSTKSERRLARTLGKEDASNGDAIPETSPARRRLENRPEEVPSSETPVLEARSTPNFQSSPPAFSTRSRKAGSGKGHERAPSSTSTLSTLASTPLPSSSNRPGTVSTRSGQSPIQSTIVASSSPAIAQTKPREARARLPKLKTASAENLRHSVRLDRRAWSSTDELSMSLAATPTFEQSLRVSRLSASRSASRSGRRTAKLPSTQRGPKLFENMAFAISFQSRKPGETNDQYRARVDYSATIEKRIKQAGGRILEDGFDELFEVLPMGSTAGSPPSSVGAEAEITLSPEGSSTGFTALVADGHSRKAKYMQALALGLPCIAARWVTTCLDRNELVDWTPYLLCAGQSAFLGDAIRSRSLAPYDAAAARLADVVGQRAKLLEGSRILAVVKKSLEGKKMAYVFLARVLGASLSRVYSVEEAKAEMKAAEDAGRPFDWVYVGGKPDQDALFAAGPAPVGGKKRKRGSMAAESAAAAVERPLKRIRTLSDELVIQSLILGRLIEEGELEE